ncbi:MAG: 4-phosphoerythronate dehydrogenase, partial [Balneolaceae bacterium]
MITVLADKYLRNLENFLPENVNLLRYDPDKGLPCNLLSGADAMLIRTVTRINADTLPEIPDSLSFIGTGSAGTDHVDIPWLKARGIHFASAAGCNARSVAEYVATGL